MVRLEARRHGGLLQWSRLEGMMALAMWLQQEG